MFQGRFKNNPALWNLGYIMLTDAFEIFHNLRIVSLYNNILY